MNMLFKRGSEGFSATEVMVAVLVAAVLTLPTMGLLFQSRDAEQRSRFEYLALLAARDEMYQSRVLVALGRKPEEIAHPPKQLTGDALAPLAPVFIKAPQALDYHEDQARVATALEFDGSITQAKRLRVGKITARWIDPAAANSTNAKGRRTSMDLVFGVVLPPPKP